MSDFEVQVIPDESGLPVSEPNEILSGDELEKAVVYLKGEYEKAANEQEGRNKKVSKWRQAMEALAADAPKSQPMKNSSNLTVPLTQTLSQNLFAKVKGTFDARDPFWTVESESNDSMVVKKNKVIQKYLNLLGNSPNDLDMESVKLDLINETVLIGGCFPKVIWSTDQWRVIDPIAGEKVVVYHDGPLVVNIPVERTKYRRGIGKISRLPWIALDTPLTEYELREMASRNFYDPEGVSKILANPRTSPTDLESQRQKSEWFDEAEQTGLFDVSEFWFYWDVDGSGVPVDLFFTIHVPSGTVLRQQYNTLGQRFVVNAKYVHRPFTLTGRGTGQMTESMQDEATAIHNLAIDNMKISNTRMFAVKRQAGFQQQTEIFPGKTFFMDNPREDINPVSIGEIYPSIGSYEGKAWSIAQKAVGLSDSQMGFADQTLGSRDTARGQAMRLQQGDSILGSVVEGLKSTFSQIGMLIWMQCVANKERVMAKEQIAGRLSEPELALLQEALNMELSDVPMRLAFNVRTTDAEKTFEAQKQSVLALTQIYASYAQQTIPLAMQLFGPEGMQMQATAPELYKYMLRVMTGSGRLMEDVFKFFGTKDVGEYVPDMQLLDQLLDTVGAVGSSFQGGGQVASMPMPGQGMPVGGQMQGQGPVGGPGGSIGLPQTMPTGPVGPQGMQIPG